MAKADTIKNYRVQIRDLAAPADAEPLYDLIQDNEELTQTDKQKLTTELQVKVNGLKQAEHDAKAAVGDKKGAEAAIAGSEDAIDKKSNKKKLKPVAESIAESEAEEEKPIHVPEGCTMKTISDEELKAINANPEQASKLVGVKPVYAGKGKPSVSFTAIMRLAIALFLAVSVATPSFAAKASDDEAVLGGGSTDGRWIVNSSGHFVPVATNTLDIGTASIIVRTIYAGIISITTATIGTLTATVSVTAPLVIATQYNQLPYFSKLTRPASGATQGSMILLGSTSATDCGTAGEGTTFAVCVSNGTNWLSV